MIKKFLSTLVIVSSLLTFSSSVSMDVKDNAERKNKVENTYPDLTPSLYEQCTQELARYHDEQLSHLTGKNVDALCLKLQGQLPGNLSNLFFDRVLIYLKKHYRGLFQGVLYNPHDSQCSCIAYNPDGDEILVALKDKRIFRWKRLPNESFILKQSTNPNTFDSGINLFTFNPNNNEVALALFNNKIVICPRNQDGSFQFHRDEFDRQELDKHTDFVECMAYNADGNELITGSWDHTVCIWQRNCKGLLEFKQQLKQHKGSVRCLGYRPGDNEFATGSWDETICIWQRNNDGLFTLKQTISTNEPIKNFSFSHDGNELAVVGFGNTISIWQEKEGSFIFKQELSDVYDCCDDIHLVYSPDDNELTIVSQEYDHLVWQRNHDGIFSYFLTRKSFNYNTCIFYNACIVGWSPDYTECVYSSHDTILCRVNYIAKLIEDYIREFKSNSVIQKDSNTVFISALAVVALINSKTIEEFQDLNSSNVFNNLPKELQKLIQKKIDFKIKWLVKDQKEIKKEKEGKESDKKNEKELQKLSVNPADASQLNAPVLPPSPIALSHQSTI
jgi:WD40 repeat protein